MNSSKYLFFAYVIAPNCHQNLLRKEFVFGITGIDTGTPVS
jgi:hypothetical protein